ncbi:4Fe-4S dicluster domain-containing protein [[Clostridium] symbiosum]|uniref:4Fe-4S dicluster domain-containing protein n=1 Tax=Clostridium symbiosum TaxID=1512 RepID=UPI001D05E0FF|nr:4Fe-4S dicluster domain-containing protein [[Clostridium] symbiosum]MCB6608560.1 SLBB domain-containing protein [[Clostridium] symbiosum]MCB6932128.1 SLBB domain-containing protein [[Clostridium] symbiosum]
MQLTELIYQAGIIGCGGAGFPTHAKYNGTIETIIINGAECEPLLQTDRYLMRNKAGELIKAADMLLRETGAGGCVIALKASYTREIGALEEAIRSLGSEVRLHRLESFFPAGDEQTIVYEVTGKVVPPAGIPLNVGCVVNNVATLYSIYEAMEGRPFTQKYLTVTGEVKHPVIAKVPIGTPVGECLKLAGGPLLSDYVVVNGGPMMGKLMTKEEAESAHVTKTMSGLIVLSTDSSIARRSEVTLKHMLNRAKSACIQCSFCSQLCPRALLGHPLEPHRIMRKLSSCRDLTEILDDQDVRNAALCCECGICEVYACPMGLQPRKVNSLLKRELAGAGIRYQRTEGEWKPDPNRNMRKAPTARVASRAGVAAFEEIRIDELKEITPALSGTVRLALRQSIGAPSQPIVKDGERVEEGQLIAVCPEGSLGSALHASISGVAVLEEQYLEIRP